MNARRLFFSAIATGLVIPMTTFAQRAIDGGLVPCGDSDDAGLASQCQACHVVELLNNVTGWLVAVLSVAAAIMFVIAGYRLLTAGGNQSTMQSAKSMIINVAIGFMIVLAAWLIIDFVMKSLLTPGATQGPWNAVQCVAQPQYAALPDAVIGSTADRIEQCDIGPNGKRVLCGTQSANCTNIQKGLPTQVTDSGGNSSIVCALGGTQSMNCVRTSPSNFDCTAQQKLCTDIPGSTATVDRSDPNQHTVACDLPGGGGSGGSCNQPTSGACSASNLTQFGSRAAQAAQICNKESGGAPKLSRSDVCCGSDPTCSNPQSFSGGYFQINILANAHHIPGCSGSFHTPNGGSGRTEGSCVKRSTKVFQKSGLGVCLGWSCQITNTAMYLTCLKATQDKTVNFAAAKSLFDAGGFKPWEVSAGLCGVTP